MENNTLYADADQINWSKVETFLRKEIPEIPNEKMEVTKFTEGYSNLTYLITFGDWEGVLRRPPFGKIPPRAHDMMREYTILRKVNLVFPYAPKPYTYGEENEVMERVFYVMERKRGVVIDDAMPEGYQNTVEVGPIISENFINNLSELHNVDYLAAGMGQLGRPEGFTERQVHGWIKRYQSSKTDNYAHLADLETWFKNNVPQADAVSIVHNDFKLNNLVFDQEKIGQINGVLDWELSTIGNPLTDLGSSLAYWGEASDPDMGITIVTDQEGFYSRRELAEYYANIQKEDLSDIHYYLSFGFYKLAAILQQIYYRYTIGAVTDERFKTLGEAVGNLMELAQMARNKELL